MPVAERGVTAFCSLISRATGSQQMVANIADSLSRLEGVYTTRLRRPLAGDATPQTLSKAREYLHESGFDVLIWGR